MSKKITIAQTDWAKEVEELEAELAEKRAELIDAEADLAEKLAAITAFEYKVRSRFGALLTKLELLDEEIESLRRKLQWLGDKWDEDDQEFSEMGSSATEEGEFRYRAAPNERRERELTKDEAGELKKLYRDLARRFHPDMAVDEEDREYRTQMMMAINAAYAAGDLEKLQKIALEPDLTSSNDHRDNDQIKAEMLQRELARIHQRLVEIQIEQERLKKHNTSKMMREADALAAEGMDFFVVREEELKDRITIRKVDRDNLQTQIDEFESDVAFTGDDFANVVWDVSLEQSLGDDDTPPEFDKYIQKRKDRVYFEEDFDDDIDMD